MAGPWKLSWHHARLGIAALWQRGVTGTRVTVAVLDTGLAAPVGLDRPDIERLDARGRVLPPFDPDGHGTCCASLIASRRGGALGVAPDAKLVSYRVLETGNSAEDVERALGHVLQHRPDVDVVSCSFTVRDAKPSLRRVVRDLVNAGKVIVAAAGDRIGDDAAFPEQTPNAITIAAVAENDRPLDGAQVGPWIDVSAPGKDIPALAPEPGRVVLFSESSAAAAVASGVAALVLSSKAPGPSRRRLAIGLEGLFKTTATTIPDVDPDSVGAGVLNPTALVDLASTLP
jgi:subtilisin family serine protease